MCLSQCSWQWKCNFTQVLLLPCQHTHTHWLSLFIWAL